MISTTAGGADGSKPNSGSGTSCNSDAVGEGSIALQPGRLIRPMVSMQLARQLVQDLYGLTANSIKELNSYDDRNFFVTVEQDYKHNNPFIEEISLQGYVLKILNSMDSRKHHIDAEHKVQGLLSRHGINCPLPVLNVKGQDKSLEEIVYDLPERGSDGRGFHIVRLLTFVPGQLMVEAPYTERLLYRVGQYVSSMQKALEGFHHPSLDNHQSIWSLDSIPKLSSFISAIQDTHNRRLVEDVIEAFQTEVIPNKGQFQKGIIHGDINEQNILVKALTAVSDEESASANSSSNHQPTEFDVCGIIDFGDVANSYYIYEVAIVIMYMMLDSKIVDLVDVGGHVLAGYSSSSGRGLNEAEFNALRVCVAARYAQSLTMGAYTYSLNPTNEYLLTSARNGWMQFSRFWNTPSTELYKRWTDILVKYTDCTTNPLAMHPYSAGDTAHTP